MQGFHTERESVARRQDGIALIITLMVLMLVSALMVGFVSAIIADQRASGLDRDQTQAYAAAHAGLEQLTSDLSGVFTQDFSPDAARIATLTATPPTLTGFTFTDPGGASGYRINFTPDVNGNPAPENAAGSTISAGPYQGFRGIITPYDIIVTARSRGGAEVRMRRTLQTVAVPVFQFGLFSENDLSFFAGPNFNFGGRVHSNANVFLAAGNGNTLTLADRVTAVGEVIRTNLSNGWDTNTNYTGTVQVIKTAPSTYRSLARNEGSLVTNDPNVQNEPAWTSLSVGTYASNIRNGRTGARRLDLPLVSQGAVPVDLIRRPLQNSNENTARPLVYDQRFFGMSAVRILLADTAAEIQQLPTVTQGSQPVPLSGAGSYRDYAGVLPPLTRPPLGSYETPGVLAGPAGGQLHGGVYKGNHEEPVLGGYIKVEIQRPGTTPTNGVWVDVTQEVLGLGIAGRNLADSNRSIGNRWNSIPDAGDGSDVCPEPNPNAIIRLQRVRDIPISMAPCGVTVLAGAVTAVSLNEHDYWENALFDAREAQTRDATATSSTDIPLAGVMHYVELDINNLRRWLAGGIGANGVNAKNDNGYILYFSDRRGKNAAAPADLQGEFGYEDNVNPATSGGAANNSLDAGEDANGDATLDIFGRTARNVPAGATTPCVAGYPNPLHAGTLVTAVLTDANVGVGAAVGANCAAGQVAAAVTGTVKPLIARANRPLFFRRALKIVNGESHTTAVAGHCSPAPCSDLPPGLTIASENPVYVQGNYNAIANDTTVAHSPASIIADAVTLLSNNWNDIRSFNNPASPAARDATDTGYRMAVVGGKSVMFARPTGWTSAQDFGTDGGAHNFLRLLEGWDGQTLNYRGSIVSFFISRQAVGSYKCCTNVYAAPTRGFNFDTDFLLPSLLPPGTPMFRDVNTLTFRQLLRPNQ